MSSMMEVASRQRYENERSFIILNYNLERYTFLQGIQGKMIHLSAGILSISNTSRRSKNSSHKHRIQQRFPILSELGKATMA
ncbi:Uncharacterized protein HZ326_28764 [Fusarium oxysporum f. sp. albedinis]|nr:Uncharacterized protein HZ326_28764 [Fusarium oxysporum f. sp. albedinis]